MKGNLGGDTAALVPFPKGDTMRGLCLGTLLVAWGVAIGAAEYRQAARPAAPEPTLQKLAENLYVIGNADPRNRETFTGGNTGIFITSQGVVVVDTKLATWGSMILNKVKSVTNKPVTTIINTHTHFDHSGSNASKPHIAMKYGVNVE